MRLTSWLTSLRRARRLARRNNRTLRSARTHRTRQPRPVTAEVLEDRTLLSVTTLFIDGELSVVSDANDDIAVSADTAGQVVVTANGVVQTVSPPVNASVVQSIVVEGSDEENVIDLSGVNAADYSFQDIDGNGVSVLVDAGNGDDTVIGTHDLDATILGGHGDDVIDLDFGRDLLSYPADPQGNRVEAGDGNDLLIGGPGDDTLLGEDGNDTVDGMLGNDWIDGHDGVDDLVGGLGDDNLMGGNGLDVIHGGLGNDSLNGGSADDLLVGGFGNDTIRGGSGNDSLFGDQVNPGGQPGDDSLFGQGGSDSLFGGGGGDSLNGGPGNDLVQSLDEMVVTEDSPPEASMPPTDPEPGTNQPPVVNDDFAETIQEGRALVDVLANDIDDDGGINIYSITITTPPANGTAFVQENGLIIFTPEPGFSGTDSTTYTVADYYGQVSSAATLVVETTPLDGRGDAISGSSGDDSLYGNFGSDSIWGGSGDDLIHGMPNADVLKGQSGNDTICGGGGADWIGGNSGDDLLESTCPGPGLAGPEIFVSDAMGMVQTEVDVLMVVDVSRSSRTNTFAGTPVGDMNGDGFIDTVLDAEIAGFIALNAQLIADGTNAQVGLVSYSTNATTHDMDSVAAGVQLATTPTADTNGNGIPDVEDVLRTLVDILYTNYEPALQEAETFFQQLGTQPGAGIMVFLSDGDANDGPPNAAYVDEVVRLRAMGIDLRAFAMDYGAGAPLGSLAIIDPTVSVISSTDEMLNALGSLGITTSGGIPFVVDLTKYGSATIQVDYATVDGSMLAGVHYVATSGTLTFLPGEQQKTVLVDPVPNAIINPGDNFFLQLSNPVNVVINDGQGEALFLPMGSSNVGTSMAQTMAVENEVPSGSANETRQQTIDTVIAQAEQLEVSDYVEGEMVVFFEDDLAPSWTAREEVVEEMGGEIIARLDLLQAAVVRLTNPATAIVDDLWNWIGHPSVAIAEPNLLRQLMSRIPDDSRFNQQWALDNIGQTTGGMPDADIDAPEAWDLHRGSADVVVAVIDTGIDHDHVDLVDNMWVNTVERDGIADFDDDGNGFIDDIFGCDLLGADSRIEDGIEKLICVEQSDSVGHGTHVAGIIGAQGNNNLGTTGVNWDVSLMELQAGDSGGIDLLASYQSMAYAFYRKHTYILEQSGQPVSQPFYGTPANIVAVNASYSDPASSLLESQMIRYLDYVDIAFVTSAGNSDSDIDVSAPSYPASYDLPNIISVAATNDRDELANYSNFGLQSVDLAAPGGASTTGSCPQEDFERGIVSTVPSPSGSAFSCGSVVDFGYLSGTSQAAAMVTGAVALLSAYNPQAPGWLVKQAILGSVDIQSTLVGKTVTGGRLNLFGAMQAITPNGFLSVDGSSPSVFSTVDLGDTLNGHSGNDTLLSGEGDDLLNGNGDRDILDAGLGNDSVFGGSGDDRLNGGGGDDTLDGQGGADDVFGDAGDDTLVWQHGGGSDNLDGGGDYNVAHARGGDQAEAFGLQENLLDLTYQTDARLQLTDGTHTTNVWFSISEVEFQPGDGDDTVTVGDLTHVPSLLVRVNGGNGDDVLDAGGADPGVVRLIFNGEDGNDTITGSDAEDTILGGAGDDLIAAGGSRDTVHGGDGDDVIGGQDGNDLLYGDVGFDTIDGEAGDDELFGGPDQDMLLGGVGDDTISGDAGRDTLNGKSGNDSLLGGEGTDRLYGGTGDDTLDGGRDNDSLHGNNGDDRLLGDHGNDLMKGGKGDDTLVGGDGNDQMYGERGDDQLGGGDGDDTINGARGDDIMLGGDGNDTMLGGSGADVVLGNLGDDYVKGQGGTRDTIAGGEGVDMVFGIASEIDEAFNVSNDLMVELDAV